MDCHHFRTTKTFQDSHGRFWIGTGSGMAQYKNNRFITYPVNDNLTDYYVFGFIETKSKKILAYTGKGVYEFSDSMWKKISLYPGFENGMCRGIIELNGDLYVDYPYDIFCKTKEGKWLHIGSLQNGDIFNFMSLQNNKIWVNTNNNIYEIKNYQAYPFV